MAEKESALTPGQIISQPELWANQDLPLLPCGKARDNLAAYMDLLLAWNKKINLTGKSSALALMRELVQDSFYLTSFLDDLARAKNWQGPNILDLGSGAGLPAIPLRLLWPEGSLTLVESREKRALFLSTVLARLGLPATTIFSGRAEDFFASSSQKLQCILSRAFMPWQKLLPFCQPQLAVNGVMVIMANQPPPVLPSGWRLEKEMLCQFANKPRWLWAVGAEAKN